MARSRHAALVVLTVALLTGCTAAPTSSTAATAPRSPTVAPASPTADTPAVSVPPLPSPAPAITTPAGTTTGTTPTRLTQTRLTPSTPTPTTTTSESTRPTPTRTPGTSTPATTPVSSRTPSKPAPGRYYFPIAPADAVDYGQTHHDYPATDMFAPCGSDVLATTNGVIQEVSPVDRWNPATDDPAVRGGLSISLIGDDGVRYYSAHLHDILPTIRPGVRVRGGQVMGHVGETGNAAGLGCHQHFGMSPPCGPGEWSIRRGTFYPWPYLDSWRSGGQKSPVAQMKQWLAAHRAECAAHRLAGT